MGRFSLHLVQSGKTHGSRAMNARPRLASASLGSLARIPTTARRSPVLPPPGPARTAWASVPHVPGAGAGGSCGGLSDQGAGGCPPLQKLAGTVIVSPATSTIPCSTSDFSVAGRDLLLEIERRHELAEYR